MWVNNNNNTTTEDTKPRERAYAVKWMREVMAEKPTAAERKAFFAKMSSICNYHGITLEELLPESK
jgi:hypothetical protein